jgi:hypothetical protein
VWSGARQRHEPDSVQFGPLSTQTSQTTTVDRGVTFTGRITINVIGGSKSPAEIAKAVRSELEDVGVASTGNADIWGGLR